MTLETATYINDLQPVNPPGTDPTSQGDDHLRLIKQVLQNQFPNASRTWAIPSVLSITTNTTLVKNNTGVVYVTTTSGPVTITLPTLTAADSGWTVDIVKISLDVNPVYVAPPSGTIISGGYGVAKGRRCIPFAKSTAIWGGSNFALTRVIAAPMASMLDYWNTTLPPGYEWPNGQTLTSGNYLEYFAAFGSYATPDLRGYAGRTLDNLGGTAAGRLPSGYISGSTLGAVGGVDAVGLARAQIPNLTVSVDSMTVGGSCSVSSGGGSNQIVIGQGSVSYAAAQPGTASSVAYIPGGTFNGATSLGGSCSASGSTGCGSGTATGSGSTTGNNHSNLGPTIMLGKILVVE